MPREMTDREKKRIFQQIKSMDHERFWRFFNQMHTRAYELAEKHYDQAMFIELQPKQKARVLEKVKEIRTEWDGITEVTIEETEGIA